MTQTTLTDHLGDGHLLIARDGAPIGTADVGADGLIVATVQVGRRFRRVTDDRLERVAAGIDRLFEQQASADAWNAGLPDSRLDAADLDADALAAAADVTITRRHPDGGVHARVTVPGCAPCTVGSPTEGDLRHWIASAIRSGEIAPF